MRTIRAEYDEQGSQWAPIECGLLKQPVSSRATRRNIDTVGHNFDTIEAMIDGMSYL